MNTLTRAKGQVYSWIHYIDSCSLDDLPIHIPYTHQSIKHQDESECVQSDRTSFSLHILYILQLLTPSGSICTHVQVQCMHTYTHQHRYTRIKVPTTKTHKHELHSFTLSQGLTISLSIRPFFKQTAPAQEVIWTVPLITPTSWLICNRVQKYIIRLITQCIYSLRCLKRR